MLQGAAGPQRNMSMTGESTSAGLPPWRLASAPAGAFRSGHLLGQPPARVHAHPGPSCPGSAAWITPHPLWSALPPAAWPRQHRLCLPVLAAGHWTYEPVSEGHFQPPTSARSQPQCRSASSCRKLQACQNKPSCPAPRGRCGRRSAGSKLATGTPWAPPCATGSRGRTARCRPAAHARSALGCAATSRSGRWDRSRSTSKCKRVGRCCRGAGRLP
mmetsp:Transcript_30224/g.96313  ORF Transcript_30224/g.96313 Transcript_30224/m.96313 type:complete len:216 (+) Transcript_30224:177-824(+)